MALKELLGKKKKKKNPQVQLLHLASGWIAEKEISQLSVGYLYSSTIYSWG